MSEAQLKEQEYVHDVYNEIASHFSETRYKPWPIVTEFLTSQTVGSIGIDVGCGNGKYLGINPNIFVIGSDRSQGLIECAHGINSQYSVMIADGLHLPHKDNTFDFAISIAVVHHWTTRERRIAAIKHIMSKVKKGGRALIYCWALEQKDSRRGYHVGMDQDVMVPWVLHETHSNSNNNNTNGKKHDHEKPDLTGIEPKDRAAFVAKWKQEREEQRALEKAKQDQEEKKDEKESATKYRFYHLYKEGELEDDCIQAGGSIVNHGYEKDNWYVITEKQ